MMEEKYGKCEIKTRGWQEKKEREKKWEELIRFCLLRDYEKEKKNLCTLRGIVIVNILIWMREIKN